MKNWNEITVFRILLVILGIILIISLLPSCDSIEKDQEGYQIDSDGWNEDDWEFFKDSLNKVEEDGYQKYLNLQKE